jgi:hypothetical protein
MLDAADDARAPRAVAMDAAVDASAAPRFRSGAATRSARARSIDELLRRERSSSSSRNELNER